MVRERKRRARSKPEEYVDYLMAIADWQWDYSFGLPGNPRDTDPFGEYRHIELHGTLLVPQGLKFEEMRITFIPATYMDEGQRRSPPLANVGELSLLDGHIGGLFSMPMNALPPVLTALAAGHFRYGVFHGRKMRYRSAEIRSYRFTPAIDLEDYEPDERARIKAAAS